LTAFLLPDLSSAPRMVGPTAPATAAAPAALMNVRRVAWPRSLRFVSESDMTDGPVSRRSGRPETVAMLRAPRGYCTPRRLPFKALLPYLLAVHHNMPAGDANRASGAGADPGRKDFAAGNFRIQKLRQAIPLERRILEDDLRGAAGGQSRAAVFDQPHRIKYHVPAAIVRVDSVEPEVTQLEVVNRD